MSIDARNERFELVEVADYTALFTNARVDRGSVPNHLFCYDIRHDDECQGIACEVKPVVIVNHWGTIITKDEIPLENGSLFLEDDMNYLGEIMTLEQYEKLNMESGQIQSQTQMNL